MQQIHQLQILLHVVAAKVAPKRMRYISTTVWNWAVGRLLQVFVSNQLKPIIVSAGDDKNGLANTVHPKIDSDEFLPSLSVVYSANENWNIFANAGVSFGPQQYSQLARLEGTTATATTEGLHPEKSNNYEIVGNQIFR